ncbi:hypothetical protein TNCV_667501 [Trichonephila clavipes]|nr:hypothetical protein TNCV_667501 [Trichonephila clavipes]
MPDASKYPSYVLVKSVGPKVSWAESRVQEIGDYPQFHAKKSGGEDRWCRHQSSPREFHRTKSYCHLYGGQGQLQAYFEPFATMNFLGLDLPASDRWH